jgi:tetratricopeptide (TPR) repeat protein
MKDDIKHRLFILLILVFFTACQPPEGNVSREDSRFQVPGSPLKNYYRVDARIDLEEGVVAGSETITFENSSTMPLTTVALAWTISETSSLDVSVGGKKIAPRPDGAGAKRKSPVYYVLPNPIAPRGRLVLDVSFNEKIETAKGKLEFLTSTWYPRLWWDGLPLHDSFSVKLDVTAGYALAASGRFDKKTGRFEAEGARSFGVYLGKGMKTSSREVDGVEITAVFTEKGAKAAAICLETAVDAVRYFKNWLGFYPFPFLTIIPGGPGRWGGYPFATGIVAIHGLETYVDGESPQHWQHITSHEIGHEYWGEWIMDSDNPAWLWIAMGIYADTEYMIARKFDPERRASWMGNYIQAIPMYYDMTLDITPAQEEKILYDYNNTVVHSKGPAVINALAVALGQETFEHIYKKCLRIFGGKSLGWRDFQKFCEVESGQNLAWFFDQWVRSNVYACYKIESTESRPDGDGFRTEIRVKRLGTMKIPVPVKAVFEDGSEQSALTDRTADIDVVEFKSRAKLKEAVLNPDKKIAMTDKPVAEISSEAARLLSWGWDAAESSEVFAAIKDELIESADLWYRLGMYLYEESHLDEARACFERVAGLKTDPVITFAVQGWLGLLEDLRGRRAAALDHYRKALSLDTGKSMSHRNLRIRIDRKWVEERLASPFSWQTVIAIPAQPTLQELRAILDKLGWTREGKTPYLIYGKAKSLVLDDVDFWFKLGMLLFDSGFYGESLDAFGKTIAGKPSPIYLFAAWTWRGHLLDLLGRRDEALSSYRKALEHDPGSSMQHSQYRMRIDRRWVETRLRSPFSWKKKN